MITDPLQSITSLDDRASLPILLDKISAGRSTPTPTRLTRLGGIGTLGLLLLSQAWRSAAVKPVLSVRFRAVSSMSRGRGG
jgi:hypothetical protein